MPELLFVIGLPAMPLVTDISLLGIIAVIVAAIALMFVGGLSALMIKSLSRLLLTVAVVWIIRVLKFSNGSAFRDNDRWCY